MKRMRMAAGSVIASNLIGLAQEAAGETGRRRYLEQAVELMKQRRREKWPAGYRNIIFDLDGTLIDTEEAILKTWQFTLREYRYFYPPEELKAILGVPVKKALQKLNVFADESFERNWIRNYAYFAPETDFFPGVKKMLLKMKGQGCLLGIVTSRCREEYEAYFRSFHLEELFERIVLADDTRKHKPEADPLRRYAELEQADPSSCIYIGDMPGDMECAKSAGMAAGMALWNRSGILSQEADFLFSSPEDLSELLQ